MRAHKLPGNVHTQQALARVHALRGRVDPAAYGSGVGIARGTAVQAWALLATSMPSVFPPICLQVFQRQLSKMGLSEALVDEVGQEVGGSGVA
jgi:hypothetical protein